MFKGMNKKGQEGLTLTTLLLIVLGVVVVVIIILGVTGVLGDIFSKKDTLPGNLEAATQSCKIAAQASLISSYCYEFKKLSDEEYANCEDSRIQNSLRQQNVDSSDLGCDGVLVTQAKVGVCEGKKDDVKLVSSNTETCGDLRSSELGELFNIKCTDPNDDTRVITGTQRAEGGLVAESLFRSSNNVPTFWSCVEVTAEAASTEDATPGSN